jgi:choline dehydrogenase-like flavoprotein
MQFDAIVVGSGMTGGWAAKELSEAGLKTLVLERGPHIEHRKDYQDFTPPWQDKRVGEEEVAAHYPVQSQCYAFEAANQHFWVRDSEHPYSTPENQPFFWIRGYHLGGRSLMWARQTYRLSDFDFSANQKDGNGVDWPIRYKDIAPWYDHVERFAGISGSVENIAHLPDGVFQPAMGLTCVEQEFQKRLSAAFPTRRMIIGRCAHLTAPTAEQLELGRAPCQYRTMCERGCSYGAYFSSLSATLPAAQRTGNVTVRTDAIVSQLIYDTDSKRISGVRVIDAKTGAGTTYSAKVVFLCASAIASAQILLQSSCEAFPNGLANRSDALGRYLMDHFNGRGVDAELPGFDDRYYVGRRPNDVYIPRYLNTTESDTDLLRGFGFQGTSYRDSWERGMTSSIIGAELKKSLRTPGPWKIGFSSFCEMLPQASNRVTLHPTRKDRWDLPLAHIECQHGANDLKLAKRATQDLEAMLHKAGCINVEVRSGPEISVPGIGIHEMGTARMGYDPATSVLNRFNQAHDIDNLFVTDGASMASSATQNPSLTYMALTARAANHAITLLRQGKL